MNSITSGSINKTLVALAVGVVVLVLAHFGFKADDTVQGALTTLVTAALVYFVPNK